MIHNIKNIDQSEHDYPVWRYLTFTKFISLIAYQALWFSKLNILRDQFEGKLPGATEVEMRRYNERWKQIFTSPDHHRQIDNMIDTNVNSIRELTVVNCWFWGEKESQKMWTGYVGNNEGVAICSSTRRLYSSVKAYPEFSLIGRVQYVDFQSYIMSMYEAHQAPERALLKDKSFEFEQEVRIVSMSIKTPWCLNLDGTPLSKDECTGKNMNNFENKGLYIAVDLGNLIQFIVLAPGSPNWFELLVKRVLKLNKLNIPVIRSAFDNI